MQLAGHHNGAAPVNMLRTQHVVPPETQVHARIGNWPQPPTQAQALPQVHMATGSATPTHGGVPMQTSQNLAHAQDLMLHQEALHSPLCQPTCAPPYPTASSHIPDIPAFQAFTPTASAPSAYTPASYPIRTIGSRTVTEVPGNRSLPLSTPLTKPAATSAASANAFAIERDPNMSLQDFKYQVMARNLAIKTANRTTYNISKNCRLYPLLDIRTGQPVARFPETTAELVMLSEEKCDRILEAISEDQTGTAAEKREKVLMCTIVGVSLSPMEQALARGES
ncbi:uncharacterized protein BROUX77_005894 [Berkeleyomyces rouxiae]|uniref:uncharacterized protein n=1 Tax=Berkeleyomyces rouxiae TaxID=2035830 RepID=UPI003B762D84